jgi:hypothetical protein
MKLREKLLKLKTFLLLSFDLLLLKKRLIMPKIIVMEFGQALQTPEWTL